MDRKMVFRTLLRLVVLISLVVTSAVCLMVGNLWLLFRVRILDCMLVQVIGGEVGYSSRLELYVFNFTVKNDEPLFFPLLIVCFLPAILGTVFIGFYFWRRCVSHWGHPFRFNTKIGDIV